MIVIPLIRYQRLCHVHPQGCETFNGVLATRPASHAREMVPDTFLQPRMTASQQALPSWLEQFDWIAVGIFNLDLSATRSRFHLVTEMDPSLF
jgi:hypothetical protein